MGLLVSTIKSSTNGNTVTTDPIDTTGAGSILLIATQFDFANPITDSYGNVYVQQGGFGMGLFASIEYWLCIGATVGPGHTFSCTPVATNKRPSVAVSAWSGTLVQVTSALTNYPDDLSADTGPLNALTNELMVGAVGSLGAGDTYSIASPWSIIDQVPYVVGLSAPLASAYLYAPSDAAYTAEWSWLIDADGNRGAAAILFTETNDDPVVDAGPDQSVNFCAQPVQLAGSAVDPDTPLDYLWTQDSGPASAVFDDDTDPATTVTFPVNGVYVLRLTVTDAHAASGYDTVQISRHADRLGHRRRRRADVSVDAYQWAGCAGLGRHDGPDDNRRVSNDRHIRFTARGQ
jgi:hypothetical protein